VGPRSKGGGERRTEHFSRPKNKKRGPPMGGEGGKKNVGENNSSMGKKDSFLREAKKSVLSFRKRGRERDSLSPPREQFPGGTKGNSAFGEK